ncbi:MAG: PilZ domain-containing protein [Pseudomonadota bacterium]|nr:PilZ domain-containing protein [Pseudomonadota bacterium]
MARPGGMRRNMLTLSISDENTLYSSYLPFLKHGGLFIPTEKNYKLGDEVFVLLTLMNDGEKTPVAGKVVWINPKGVQGRRPQGIGVQFSEQDRGATRNKIEKYLANLLKSEKNTYTM